MPYPTTILKDNFDRVDNASLGAGWTEAVIASTNRALISNNRVTTSGVGASTSNAYTAGDTVTGKYIAMDYTIVGFGGGVNDLLGHAAAVVAATTTGYRTELDPQGVDLIVHFLRTDSTIIASVTCTGKGEIQVNDRIGFVVNDNNTTAALEFWLNRTGTWVLWASTTASAGNYIAGPYYPGFRIKYDTDVIDNFSAGLGSVLTAPTAPLTPAATAGDAQVILTWTAPASNGGSAVTAYKIYRSTTTNTETLLASPAGTGTNYVDATAANGTTYFYKISAVNAIGESVLSSEASATPAAPIVPLTVTRKRFYGPALLGNTAATIYTCPAATTAVIRHIHVSNPSGSPVPFTFSIGTSAAGTRLWDAEPMDPLDVEDHLVEHILTAGEFIQAFAGSAATLNLTVDGYELTGSAPSGVILPSDSILPSDFPAYPDDTLLPH